MGPNPIDRFYEYDDGRLVHTWPSNFFWVFNPGNQRWVTVEHLYQAEKGLLPAPAGVGQCLAVLAVLTARSPGEAKRRGRAITIRPNWDDVKDERMLHWLRWKYRDADLRAQLAATGDALMIEGNFWHDNHFGDCRCGRRRTCEPPGKNRLGELIMQIRGEL